MQDTFGVRSLRDSPDEMMAALYLQVSIISQALIFVTRSRSWSVADRPGLLLLGAFLVAQLVSLNLLFIKQLIFSNNHIRFYNLLLLLRKADRSACLHASNKRSSIFLLR